MASLSRTPTWILSISNQFDFTSSKGRQAMASDFAGTLYRFALNKQGNSTAEWKDKRNEKGLLAFREFREISLEKALEPLNKKDLPASFWDLVHFCGERPLSQTVSIEMGVEESTANSALMATFTVPTMDRETGETEVLPSQSTSACIFVPEAVSTREEKVQVRQTVKPTIPSAQRKASAASDDTKGVKVYSPKTKLTPKGKAKFNLCVPKEIKEKLLAVASQRVMTPTNLIIELIQKL